MQKQERKQVTKQNLENVERLLLQKRKWLEIWDNIEEK